MYAISSETARHARLAIVLVAGFLFLPVTTGHIGQIGYASAWAGDQGGGHDKVPETQSYTGYSASEPVPATPCEILSERGDGQRICAAGSTALYELFGIRERAGDRDTLPILSERSDGQWVCAAGSSVTGTASALDRGRDVNFESPVHPVRTSEAEATRFQSSRARRIDIDKNCRLAASSGRVSSRS